MITEPTLDSEHIAALLEEEPRRRHSTNSIPFHEVSEANLVKRTCDFILCISLNLHT